MTNLAPRLLTIVCAAAFAVTTAAQRPGGTTPAGQTIEWRDIGGDKGSTRYSGIDQINAANVRTLAVAWRRPVVAEELREKYPEMRRGASRATPLMIGGVLYAPNAIGLVEAFDAASGRTVWIQQLPDGEPVNGTATRAVAYWGGGGEERLYVLRNAQLWALDARTGQLATSFGDRGRVDLRAGLGPLGKAGASWNFAPFVCNDVVIVGVSLNDNIRTKQEPPGVVQAFDVRSGKPRWTFNPVPRPGEVGNETWENDSWAYSGSANVWSFMSADEDLGYVYLPTGSPTSDMYGGHRLGNNLFSNSLVCLQCASGRRVWHFQTIHHDLWDWDNNVAPIVADIVVNGQPIKAVVQLTKQAMAYVLDRTTGRPVWPIDERPVPPTTTPGERVSPTQPFPSRPAPFDRHGLTQDDLIDFTPELRREAIEIAKRYVIGPIFTPPSLKTEGGTQGTLQLPGEIGGAQYTGSAFDRSTGMLYVPSITSTFAADLIPGDDQSGLRYVRGTRQTIGGPQGLPLMKPPYGRITAIDLNTGTHAWMTPNADGPRDHPAVKHLKLGPLGQPTHDRVIATPTLLLAVQGDVTGEAATPPFGGPNGKRFRAYDKKTGAIVYEMPLPAGATGGMVTYLHQGKQYVVFPIGTTDHTPEILALSVP